MKSSMKMMRLMAAAMVLAVGAASCSDNEPEVPPTPGNPGDGSDSTAVVVLENKIAFAGDTADVKTVFRYAEDGAFYLSTVENCTSIDSLGRGDYIKLSLGTEATTSTVAVGDTLKFDMASVPQGFELVYSKGGTDVVAINDADNGSVTGGTLTFVYTSETAATIDFALTLAESTLEGNAKWTGNVVETEKPANPTYPGTAMTFVVNGKETAVGTVFCDSYDEYVLITASPDVVETYDEMLSGRFIQIMVLPQFLNQDIDLMQQAITISAWDGTSVEGPQSITSDKLTYGQMRVNHDEATNEYTLLMAMTFTDATQVGVNASATMTAPAPEEGNTITVNGETQPIRAQFYTTDGADQVYLYFTSAEVESFNQMAESAYNYFFLALNEDDLTGNAFDIATSGKTFTIYYVSNLTGDMLMADNNNLDGATGTIGVSRDATDQTKFTAYVAVTFGNGTSVSIDFEGTCLSTDYEPETPEDTNEFTCFGATEAINSILVDKSDTEVWHIYFTATPGLTTVNEFVEDWAFHITAPAAAFDGEPNGFSTYKDTLKFEYDGNTWQYPGTGTFTATLEGNHLELDFTTYGDVEGHYSGTVTVVE